MAKKTAQTPYWIALLATVFVVGGVVAVVLTRPAVEGEDGQGIVASDATLSGRVVVYASGDALHVIDADDGVELKECAIADGARIARVNREGILVGAPNSGWVQLGFDCMAEDEVLMAALQGPDEEEVVTLVVGEREIPLRHENGRPFREPQVIGWLDDHRVVLVAFRGDVRYVVLAEATGELHTLAALPEIAEGFTVGNGSLWYVTATPGEGIEFGPSGPSAIHRVGTDGTDVVVVREPSALIESLSVSDEGMYAYTVGGTLMLGRQKALVNAGTGMPVGWTDDSRLLVVDAQRALTLKSLDGATEETGVVLSEDVWAAWLVSLDERAAIE
jgi:hypothetical protein